MKLTDVAWQQTCRGDYAEVQTGSGWARLRREGDGYLVTLFDPDGKQTAEPTQMTVKQTEKTLG